MNNQPTVSSSLDTIDEDRSYELMEKWQKKGVPVASRSNGIRHFDNMPLIKWGSSAKDECSKAFTNTCTLDNVFMVLIYAYHNILAWRQFLHRPRNQLMETIGTLMNLLVQPEPKVNGARFHYVRSILDLKPTEDVVNLAGDELSNTLERLQSFSTDYLVERHCEVHGIYGTDVLKVFGQCNLDVMSSVQLINSGGSKKRCPTCTNAMENVVVTPPRNAVLPVIPFGVVGQMELGAVPLKIRILADEYILFACTVYKKGKLLGPNLRSLGHYRTGFYFEKKWYGFDAMAQPVRITARAPKHDKVSTAWYKRSD